MAGYKMICVGNCRVFFLYFICFWVFTVFTSTRDTSQISTCINLHYTTLLHKENTTTLDYENKRKERKGNCRCFLPLRVSLSPLPRIISKCSKSNYRYCIQLKIIHTHEGTALNRTWSKNPSLECSQLVRIDQA